MAEVTLGGDRIGSGNKQKVELHNYGMNSFNQSQDFKSSMAPGILYPFIKLVGTNHGTFDIDLDTIVKTLPTKGPLFGTFKFQLDLYSVPFRLYQGILHNNPVGIGLKMNQVYLPKLLIETADGKDAPTVVGSNADNCQVHQTALAKYLGLSGIGHSANQNVLTTVKRKINAVPYLAYYDIFKCYYANKQEQNAYVITPGAVQDKTQEITDIKYHGATIKSGDDYTTTLAAAVKTVPLYVAGTNIKNKNLKITLEQDGNTVTETITDIIKRCKEYYYPDTTKVGIATWLEREDAADINPNLIIYMDEIFNAYGIQFDDQETTNLTIEIAAEEPKYAADIILQAFNLANIDDMRNALLSSNTLGAEFVLGDSNFWGDESGTDETGLPYSALFNKTTQGITWNAFAENGLVVKTYQSDLFNNWLDTEFIDGENGISAISAVDTTGGSFTMDTLNLAEKIYELLNRVLVSGGTYQDWQEAVYGEGAVKVCETPMYVGGMSAEILFEEVTATTAAETEHDKLQSLGSLGGKGGIRRRPDGSLDLHGGRNIHVKMDEPGYIIGIASITPRICYSQGNDWDLTELDTLDDLHKPALDGIGFQDLMVEQFAWWNTVMTPNSTTVYHRDSAGKQTAWINYQTAVDKCFGDFADQEGYAFMVLNRNYEHRTNNVFTVEDITTYIDPAKYNYAFSYTKLDAQNFWVQIHSYVTARRKMGAQQLPNL